MPDSQDYKVEPILKLLTGIMAFFTVVLIGVEYAFKDDAQVFQVMAGILTGVVGAFLARIKPAKGETGAAGTDSTGPSVTIASSVTTKTANPPSPPIPPTE